MIEPETTGRDAARFIHTLPNMADDELDPYQYRLLGHYERRANHTGEIDEGIRDTADACHMSVNKARAARAELAALGYLVLTEPTREEQQRGVATHVQLVDRAAENEARYACSVSNLTHPRVSDLTHGGVSKVTQSAETPVEGVSKMTQGGVSNLTPIESDSNTDSPSLTARKGESEPQGSELPYHVANGFGMTGQPPRYGEAADQARQHPLVQAFMLALPEGARPPITATYLDVARRLEAAGFTPAHVSGKVGEQVAAGRIDYAFAWLEQDLPPWRYALEHPTVSRSVPRPRASPRASPRSNPSVSALPPLGSAAPPPFLKSAKAGDS